VLLGILLLHERPTTAEYVGMAVIPVAVFLLTTARVRVRGARKPQPVERVGAE
jgi:drug/metabolite transporter (DMT)-like permease